MFPHSQGFGSNLTPMNNMSDDPYGRSMEFRVDPLDGGTYTYNQVVDFYGAQYTPQQLAVYYWHCMAPVNFFMKKTFKL